MPWAWVRPADLRILAGRPLLDLGTGDGQTLAALAPGGLTVGVDRRIALLSPGNVAAEARVLPFKDGSFATTLAADLFHHLPDDNLADVLDEVFRVTSATGRLVAWWYEEPGREAPDAPRYPRSFGDVAWIAGNCGFKSAEPLELISTLEPSPATTGILAKR